MNKFKTLTILILMLGSIATAQEKQNDATWEETIDFLNKHLAKIDIECWEYYHSKDKNKIYTFRDEPFRFWGFIIKKDKLTFEKKVGTLRETLHKDLNKLLSIEYNCKDYFVIESNICLNFTDSTLELISFKDVELRERMFKAFNHLTYLATEKRKKERETSGDKF